MATTPIKYRSTRFPKGVTNQDPRHPMAQLRIPDPLKSHIYANDFDQFVSGDWTATNVGTGSNALTAGDGGLLLLTTSAAAADSRLLTKLPAGFTMTAGYRNWFRMGCTLSDATNTVFIAGLVNAITTYTPTDGIFFSKADTSTSLLGNFSVASSNTATASLGTLANATQFIFAAEYNGNDKVFFWFNDVMVASIAASSLPSVNLTPAFGVQSGAAAGAKTLTVDFLLAGKERADLNPVT